MPKLTPIFVGGTGRSGTTILKRLFRQHPRIVAIPMELRLIIDPGGALDLAAALSTRWSPVVADEALTRFEQLVRDCGGLGVRRRIMGRLEGSALWPKAISPGRYSGWGVAQAFGQDYYQRRMESLINGVVYHTTKGHWLGTKPYRVGPVIRETEPRSREEAATLVASCFDDLYSQIPSASGPATHWLEDTPYNLLYAKDLLETFPGSRFIHIYRDPRDVLASYQTKVWGGDDFPSIARRLGGILRQWFRVREEIPEDSYLEIALEEMVADPQGVLTRATKYAGLDLDPAMLEVPLDKAHSGRWKKDVPADQMKKAEPYLAEALKAYGYSRSDA